MNKDSSHPDIAVLKWALAEKSALFLLNGNNTRSGFLDNKLSKRVLSSLLVFSVDTVSADSIGGESIVESGVE